MTRIAFLMDPLDSLSLKKDSTLAMIRAAQRRGWEVAFLEQKDLLLQDGEIQAVREPHALERTLRQQPGPGGCGGADG